MNLFNYFCNKQLFSLLVFSVSLISVECYAAPSYHGDSVMSPGGFSTAPIIQSGQNTSSGNQYTSTQVVNYQTGTCPTGLTSNGSPFYHSAQQVITSTYLGTQLVGTTVGPWTDTDTDCIGYQYQVLGCPSGYTGEIDQQQKISTGTGGLVYGGWTTTTNSCVVSAPPVYYATYYCRLVTGSHGGFIEGWYTMNSALGYTFKLNVYYDTFGNTGTVIPPSGNNGYVIQNSVGTYQFTNCTQQ